LTTSWAMTAGGEALLGVAGLSKRETVEEDNSKAEN